MLRVAGLIPGVVPLLANESDAKVTAGILIFAIGIVVGLSCVLAMDYLTRKKMERDYKAWVAMGKPERRTSERRGKVKKMPDHGSRHHG